MLGVLEQVRLEHVVRNTIPCTGHAPSILDAAEVDRTDDDVDVRSVQVTHVSTLIP